MATKQFNLKDATASGSSAGSLQDGGSITEAATTTSMTTTDNSLAADTSQIYGVTNTQDSVFQTAPAVGLSVAAKDCWRSENTLNGSFAAGTWTLNLRLTCLTSGLDDQATLAYRLWRSVNAIGSSPTQLTSGIIRSSVFLISVSGNQIDSAPTVSLGAVSLSNEYLFLQVAISFNGAGLGFQSSVNPKVGSLVSMLTTTDFTASGGSTTRMLTSLGAGT